MVLLFRYLLPHPHRMAGLLLRTKSRSLTDPRIRFAANNPREKREKKEKAGGTPSLFLLLEKLTGASRQ